MLRKVIIQFLVVLPLIFPYSAHAILSMELTRGVAGAIPVAIVPFANMGGNPDQDVSKIISTDLQNSGRFKVYGRDSLSVFPSDAREVSADVFRKMGTDNVVVGKVEMVGDDRYQVSFQLLDLYHGKGADSILLSKKYTISGKEMRALSHHISDLVFEQLTGVRGIFSTRLAYVVVQHSSSGLRQYHLEVADQDGYNPRSLLESPEPIMSPSWSPNGKKIAYVSFENKHSAIYVQDVATGARQLISKFPGINGAPAWSPDGSKLAMALSKSGSLNIYIMDIASRRLKQVTNDYYINTEPAWSPNGKSLLYTSNRGGGVQVYQVNLASGSSSRISYDGDYNARASYTRDGNHIVMIHKVSGVYYIGILDLESGTMKVLNSYSGDSSSPSVAPNGSMILFDTLSGGRSVLGMVSADARIALVLPARNGEAQDPAWSPFLD